MKDIDVKGHLIALFTVLIWSETFISTKFLLKDFTPLEILFIRFFLGLIALLAVSGRIQKVKRAKDHLYFILAGLCGVTLYFLLENTALLFTNVSNVSILVATTPFFTGIISLFILKDTHLNQYFYIGFLLAFTGIIIICFNGNFKFELHFFGDLLALGASIVWGLYSITTRKIINSGYDTIDTTKRVFLYGLILLLPVIILSDFSIKVEKIIKPVNLVNLIFLGVLASAICFATWGVAIRRLGAVKTSIYIYAVPVISIISAVIILDEPLTLYIILGTSLTLAGLVLSQKTN